MGKGEKNRRERLERELGKIWWSGKGLNHKLEL